MTRNRAQWMILALFLGFLFFVPHESLAATVHVNVTDNVFTPRNVTIAPGDTAIWTNNGGMQHTVTADNGSFDSGYKSTGQTYSRTFTSTGTFSYYCIPHGGPGGAGMAGTVTVVAPVVTSQTTQTSSSASDALRVQVSELLSRIQTLQQQISAGGSGAGVVPVIPAPAGSCPRIGRVLKMGSSGADVTRLQQFLAADPAVYPEGTISGYYGALTEAAVKRFQCKNKIVCDGTPDSTGYGVTGPRTAAILSLQCPDGGGSGPASGFIKVTPTTGAPPLTVTAQATVNTARSCSAATYTVDFGDGSPQGVVNVPANGCAEMQQLFSHTYTRQGTYQVILRSGVHQVSATVTVSGVSIPSADDSIKASPLSGAVPLTVSFSGVVNASSACNAGPYSINFGDNQAVNISVAGCNSTNYSLQHTYTSGGTYTARLYRGNPAVNVTSVSINAGDSASTGGRFSVTPITGSTAQVRASFDLSSSCARYDLDWGDGSAHASQSEGSCAAGTTGKELTHTYDKAGSYTIKLKRGSSLNYTDTVGLSVTF